MFIKGELINLLVLSIHVCFKHLFMFVFLGSQNSKCKVLTKFSLGVGGFLGSQNSKCQVLAKFSLAGGGGILG